MNSTETRRLTVVGLAPARQPRSAAMEPPAARGSRDAAYRRLAVVMLGLDVASLSRRLQAERLAAQRSISPAA